MYVLKKVFIKHTIFTVCIQLLSIGESCLNCGRIGSPYTNLEKYRRNAYWWKRRAEEELDNWQRNGRFSRRFRRIMRFTSGILEGYAVPPVVHPPWDSSIPKFNAIIVRRMGNQETPLCSGALISSSFILTVGSGCVLMHGFTVYSPDDLITRFVSYDPESNDILTYEMQVKRIMLHEGCCRPGHYLGHNDIALVQLTDQLNYDDYIQPALITKRTILHHPAVNEHWDLTNFRIFHLPSDFTDAVWFVRTNFISTNICDSVIPTRVYHKLQMTCASYHHKDSEDCCTDQGSPLSYKGELIGLLLYRKSCGGPGQAALFVNIGVQSKWIRKNVQLMSNGQEAV